MQQNKRQSLKKYGIRFLMLVCAGVFIYAAYGLIDIFMDRHNSEKVAADVQETYYEMAAPEKKKPLEKEETDRPEFDALQEENEDVVGWIKIDDTKIDYPILHSADNQEYLTEDFNREKSDGGSIFMDYRNDIDALGQNTIVYGHRMKDGSMFQHLTKFLDKDFYDEHPTFDVETVNGSYEAEIFAVYNTTTDFYYIQTDFEDEADFEGLIDEAKHKSEYETDVDINANDDIITLSTCDYELDENEGRLVVQAKLVQKD